jgi:xanthine dehydrogenase accessory factor
VREDTVVLVKGAGDLGSGVIFRLFRAGFRVVGTEIERPTTVRRTVAFAEAVYNGEVEVEGVRARLVANLDELPHAWSDGVVPLIVDPESKTVKHLKPKAVVDAIVAKRNLGTRLDDAPVVIGIGPGFTAGLDVHAVIESNRGHYLGRVLWQGAAQPNTGVPGEIGGHGLDRVLRAPRSGVFVAERAIGDSVRVDEVVCRVDGQAVKSKINGILRGLLRDGLTVHAGMKIGDVDPRARREHCFTFSDKALAVAGGVLEALMYLLRQCDRRWTTRQGQ